jgi:hypothetical protein
MILADEATQSAMAHVKPVTGFSSGAVCERAPPEKDLV